MPTGNQSCAFYTDQSKSLLLVRGILVLKDTNTLLEIRKDWNGVEALRNKLRASAFASMGILGGIFPFTLSNAAHNLPFLHAFSVLNEVLIALEKEGRFKCNSIFLGKLLEASEMVLPWKDFSTIETGVGRRNDVAHRADLLERAECWKYVDAIKLELSLWGIV